MGDEETMKMLAGGNLRIMVGGQVVGMSAKPIHIVTENYTKAEAIAEAADIKRSFEITGNAIVQEPSQALRDMFNDMMCGKMDVTIEQKVGKLPRKMKKALHSKRMTKWNRKVASYINRRQIRIRDAEMVVTPDQFDTLKATISGGTIEHGCVVSGKQISEALERYKHRHS
jgi:hypothetical protein